MSIIKRFASEDYVKNEIQTELIKLDFSFNEPKQMDYVAVPEELRLGCYRSNVNGTGRFAQGILNECKIYDVALSDEQLTEFLTN